MLKRLRRGAAGAALMLGLGGVAVAQPPFDPEGIIVRVVGLDTNAGTVHCSLYARERGFPSEPRRAFRRVTARPSNGNATCRFRDIEPGRYAVAVWHDVDGDGELDANFLGIPKEQPGPDLRSKRGKAAGHPGAPPLGSHAGLRSVSPGWTGTTLPVGAVDRAQPEHPDQQRWDSAGDGLSSGRSRAVRRRGGDRDESSTGFSTRWPRQKAMSSSRRTEGRERCSGGSGSPSLAR